MRRSQSLAKIIGLLAGCIATLIGVACGNEPFIVFARALISGIGVWLLTAFGLAVVHLANMEPPVRGAKPTQENSGS
ncbi:MAG: hypothetical protein R3C03_15050 [Pirellulaceae bacterium]